MGEITNEIEREIEAERDELGRNLTELEKKAQQLGDWRTHYRNNTTLLLGVALASGLALGAMGRRGRSSPTHHTPEMTPSPRPKGRATRQLEDTWLNVSDALLGIASAKVLSYVGSVVPGFSEQIARATSLPAADRVPPSPLPMKNEPNGSHSDSGVRM